MNKNANQGAPASVIWLTGFSGAGKTTIARELLRVMQTQGRRVEMLDGDIIRAIFPNTGFSREERNAHVKRVGFLASLLVKHGVFVIVALISPYRESREFARSLCPRFVEVHVSTPLEECERRDGKGLYAKARKGELRNFTGIDDPYEVPESPSLVLDTRYLSVEAITDSILTFLDSIC